ncbi:hypothetical protein [Luteolibacter luteus]|uniref:Prepilin-type N-terminal cleavage/methylation domain-containing protein n=1 Tax=Luteolibacter luteus TaxID=2728835 RepID=A0A858RMQ8_9BACT|nr:hypothetical protein [Luteolibacter luteus]QJE97649.1 hypothetical protein HHL09_18315 [Luteolibacter luteus]
MKASPLPLFRRALRRGYTLIELSLAMMTGMMIAAMLLAIFNQQVAFLKIFNAQTFLTTEAPIINNYLSRVIGSAEGFQLYTNMSTLRAGGSPVLEEASVLLLLFKEPDGSSRAAILSYENPGTGEGLYYRRVTQAGTISDPEWVLSKEVRGVSFSVIQGVLRATLTGPNEETITYSGAQQL